MSRWYYKLDDVKDRKFIVRQHIYSKNNNNGMHRFRSFDNRIRFFEHMKTLKSHQRSFYEIILEDSPRKLFFDVDDGDEECLEHLYRSIDGNFQDIGINLDPESNILQYSSHGKNKLSYHIVINGFFFLNSESAKVMAEKIISEIPEEYQEFVDKGVYSGTRSLRTLYSTKFSEKRYKKLDRKFEYLGDEVTLEEKTKLQDFLDSSITYIEESVLIPIETPERKKLEGNIEDVGEAYQLLLSELNIDEGVFEIRDVNGPFISLRRLRKSYCRLCDRIHESENPYMFSAGGNLYFSCRRSDKNLYLGKLYSSMIEDEEEEETSIIDDLSDFNRYFD